MGRIFFISTRKYLRLSYTFSIFIHISLSMSTHTHDHSSHDDHAHGVNDLSSIFFLAISINIVFVLVEIFFGIKIHSLALLSDAGHNTMDILNLILSGIALWLSKKKHTKKYTYGYKRASILSALLNSLLLIFTAVFLIFEAYDRMMKPIETVGTTMMIVAGIGILINGLSGWLLMK